MSGDAGRWLTVDEALVAIMLFAIGFAAAVANIASVSSRQRIVPTELLGRVNSAYRLLGSGGQPIGALLGGLLAELLGLPALFVVVAAVQLAALAAVQAPITDAALGVDRPQDRRPQRDRDDRPHRREP